MNNFSFDVGNLDLNNILVWVAFGVIIGLLAYMLDRSNTKGNPLYSIVAGVLGSLIGGAAATYLFNTSLKEFNYLNFALAALGGLVLVALQRALTSRNDHIKTDV